jgi:hypothetical protein
MRKRFAGIDIGSRSIELVVVDDSGKIVISLQTDTGFDPMTAAKDLIHGVAYDCIMATGYGRNLFEISFETLTVTEMHDQPGVFRRRYCFYRWSCQKPLYAAFPGGNIGQKRSGTRRSPTGRGSGRSASGQGNPVKIN